MSAETDKNSIGDLLGLYKAEWLNGKIFEMFNEPTYFGELKTSRPCVLIGGRGTGKTTVLKGLSYQGQLALNGDVPADISRWSHYGIYYRVNTNRVTAFRGPEVSHARWVAYFSHYINLLFCQLLLEFAAWFELRTQRRITISDEKLKRVAATLSIDVPATHAELLDYVSLSLLRFEAAINNIQDASAVKLSMLGAPIDALSEGLTSSVALEGKQFYFLIDEFENFDTYQHLVLNTLIKHATPSYTFKIGVRQLAWRERSTLNSAESLTSPADYVRINIDEVFSDAKFKSFAERVIIGRLAKATGNQPSASVMSDWFPQLSELDEADLLLDGKLPSDLASLMTILPPDIRECAFALRQGVLYFLWRVALTDGTPLEELLSRWSVDDKELRQKFNNYFFSFLFAIREGKRGIRKYYAGWDTFVALAAGNIRYLLELVHEAYIRHLEDAGVGFSAISPEVQTRAAEAIGKKNLAELEGLSVNGARLTKLLLSLGRTFNVLAQQPFGHTPELNQFAIQQTSAPEDPRALELLDQAVMHLALVRSHGNKPTSEVDTRAYDYMIHPIYAPFFVFSHRRKRKFGMSTSQLSDLVDRPRLAIQTLLYQNNREVPQELPEQLQLFESFYAGA